MTNVIKFEVNESNWEQYVQVEEDCLSETTVDEFDLEEFDYTDDEVFLEITNQECYRPGHVDKYVERDGVVYFIDDLNDNLAMEMSLSKEQVLEVFKQFI